TTTSVHLYRSMIGCLMYLTATRPDIMFAVCADARHQVTPKTSNLLSVKRIFKYLTAYPKLGLWYPQDSPFDLEAFSDSDYAGEPALVQAQPQEVSPPPLSHVVEPHPLTDPMPSPPRQTSPSPILFGPAPRSGVASTDPIPEIPSSSKPTKPVLETITSPIRDDDTSGGSFLERPPSPSFATLTRSPTVGVTEEPLTLNSLLALFPTCLQRIATLEAEIKATKILHRDVVVLFAKRIKKLESKLKTKKRKLVLTLHDPSASTTPSKPHNQEQSSEQEISPTTLDAQSSSGLDFTDAAKPAAGRVSAGGADPAIVISTGGADPAVVISTGGDDPADVISAGGADPVDVISAGGANLADVVVSDGDADSAGTFIFDGVSVAAGPSVSSAPSSPIRHLAKGKAIATPSSPVTAPSDKELA
nr:putative ribonuclease H-like domain-containing protein [Tanacetum cinerariifolium]